MFPISVKFQSLERSDFIENYVMEQAGKLARHGARIVSCNVMILAPHRKHQKGKIYHTHIQLFVPGGEVVVSHEPEMNPDHENAYLSIRDAFLKAKRRLDEYQQKLRADVKAHSLPTPKAEQPIQS